VLKFLDALNSPPVAKYPKITFRELKVIFTLLVFIVFLPASGFAYLINLEWDPSPDEDVAGYIVHYGKNSRKYQHSIDIGDFTTCSISGLKEGKTYYFAVTAYDFDDFESDYSEEISYSREASPVPSSGRAGGGGGGGGGGCFIAAAGEGQLPVLFDRILDRIYKFIRIGPQTEKIPSTREF
jgi:hypothetical protein